MKAINEKTNSVELKKSTINAISRELKNSLKLTTVSVSYWSRFYVDNLTAKVEVDEKTYTLKNLFELKLKGFKELKSDKANKLTLKQTQQNFILKCILNGYKFRTIDNMICIIKAKKHELGFIISKEYVKKETFSFNCTFNALIRPMELETVEIGNFYEATEEDISTNKERIRLAKLDTAKLYIELNTIKVKK